jgi:DNA polymerase III delta prime subunit
MFAKHINKDNLHHAYLIEGKIDCLLPELLLYLEKLNITIKNNPDFISLFFDTLRIDDAQYIKSLISEKKNTSNKRIFIITVNNFLLDAQNTLLKIFEEPTVDNHFFIISPDTNSLLRTLVSRFYLIKTEQKELINTEIAQKFIKKDLKERLIFIKELLSENTEEEAKNYQISSREKASRFLDSLELVLKENLLFSAEQNNIAKFEHILKVREFLRQPGSSIKMLLESVAIIVPKL